MLAHVLGPREDDEGFHVVVGVGRVTEEAPAYSPLPAAEAAHRIHSLDVIARLGSPQCMEGVRSRPCATCSGQRQVAASPQTSANPAPESATPLPNCWARAPQARLPTASRPWKTSM